MLLINQVITLAFNVRGVLLQDERVMQLFGLVNTMLANDRVTAERDLSIARQALALPCTHIVACLCLVP